MITHVIRGQNGDSRIILGESIDNLAAYTAGRQTIVMTDENVYRCHRERVPDNRVIVIPPGEEHKTLYTVETIYQKMFDLGFDRSGLVVAIGGGIVCDVAGFAASTYLRGVAFGFVPTTLLAQVDASVGGKNGVNFGGYKNLIGTFNQPEFVLVDFNLLKTLPTRALGCGFAEALKHGAIANPELFAFMESQAEALKALDPASIERIVSDSIVIKSAVVNQDEKEHGERRKLNFGHTFGHAIEKTLGLPHGEAIAIGMVVAARLSAQRGYLSNADVTRLTAALTRLDLPVSVKVDPERMIDALWKDKKRYGDTIKFILLERIGSAIIQDVTVQELETVLKNLE